MSAHSSENESPFSIFLKLTVIAAYVDGVPAQGWYVDPFQTHDARWIPDGRPTALVRDGDRESSDPPPAEDCPGPLVPLDRPARQAVTPTRPGLRSNLLDIVGDIADFIPYP